MSSFILKCPLCGNRCEYHAELTGMSAECSVCHHKFSIEMPNETRKPSKTGSPAGCVGCLLFVVWLLAFFVAGWNYPNSNASAYIFFALPVFLLTAGAIYAVKKTREEKKVPESLIAGIVMLIFIVAVIIGIAFLCRGCGGSMKSKVEEKAFGIVYLSSGKRASGFRSDSTVISGNKAVCHFRYRINGEERLCSIEFKIENGEPIPSGNFVVDEN